METNLAGAHAALLANAVNAQIVTSSQEVLMFVNEMLSFSIRDRASGSWSGRSSFFNFERCTFPAGFLYAIGTALASHGVTTQYRVKEAPAPVGPAPGTEDPMGLGFSERYDYQPKTIERLLALKRMVAQVATGGGKSRIAILAHHAIGRRTMFLTTRGTLLYQMKDQFDAHGFACGVIGDGIWEPRRGVNVCMVQTLAQMLQSPSREHKARQFLESVDLLIGEEAHEIAGAGYYEIANACTNAHYRLALTGTPFMKEDEEDNMRLQAVFGSIGIQITEKTLIDRGILAEPFFKYFDSPKPPKLSRKDGWPVAQQLGLVENETRNAVFVHEALRMKQIGFPVISLIQREKHGHILREKMQRAGLSASFLSGKADQSERQFGLRALSSGALDVLIGSTIFDVGVDVPSVGMVQLAGGGKDEVALRQRVGRGLRAKKTGRNVAFILDSSDRWHPTTREHGLIRRTLIEKTPGFGERVLAEGKDFPL